MGIAQGGGWTGLGVAFALLTPSVQAQDRRSGLISGRVSDSTDNPLPGAAVRLLERGLGTTTDRDGRFILTGLPPGQYRIAVRYIGFRPDTLAVAVQPGAESRVEVVMGPLPASLPEIKATAARPRGEVQALAEQKSSDNNITDGRRRWAPG
jgi:hypothetical protein